MSRFKFINLIRNAILILGCFILSTTPIKAIGSDIVKNQCKDDSRNIIGNWVAQIDLPQSKLTILMNINILDQENCVIKCKWSVPNKEKKKETGRAKYYLDGNRLVITFLNNEEIIQTDNIFDKTNVYDISLTEDKLVILNNRQFRNVDVTFGRGYKNRGFAKIIFP